MNFSQVEEWLASGLGGVGNVFLPTIPARRRRERTGQTSTALLN
jgi:hypothetical protein